VNKEAKEGWGVSLKSDPGHLGPDLVRELVLGINLTYGTVLALYRFRSSLTRSALLMLCCYGWPVTGKGLDSHYFLR